MDQTWQPERIEVVGSVNAEAPFSEATIRGLLDREAPAPLGRGEFFVGRPGTGVVCQDGLVAKTRLDLNLDWPTARRWTEHALSAERSLGLHHPRKTWFLARVEGTNRIGNVAPLLDPLHQALPQQTGEEQLRLLERLLSTYLDAATAMGKRLDEGLSNFGLDGEGRLFYLDDDTYEWDNFLSLAEALGHWLRLPLALGPEGFRSLGEVLAQAILRDFADPHWLRVLAQRLDGLFMANADQSARRDALRTGLQGGHPSYRARATPPERTPDEPEPSETLAILGDVHANRPALEAVLDQLQSEGITRGIVLGDVVGYGPHPRECIDLLRQSNLTIIKGNHDHGVANDLPRKGFSKTAYWVVEWTREILDREAKDWLDDLPCCMEGDGRDWVALHGAPQDPTFFNGYVYLMTYEANLDELERRQTPICFHGHTHIQGTYFRPKEGADGFSDEGRQDLREWRHSLVCPGSVGQPRDRQPGAAFATFEPGTGRLTHRRVDYDMEPVIQEMEGLGFPQPLMDRLRSGR